MEPFYANICMPWSTEYPYPPSLRLAVAVWLGGFGTPPPLVWLTGWPAPGKQPKYAVHHYTVVHDDMLVSHDKYQGYFVFTQKVYDCVLGYMLRNEELET